MLNKNLRTVVLSESRPLDKEKVDAWIHDLFVSDDIKVLSSKGVFNFIYCDYIYEFESYSKTFNSKADQYWQNDDDRKSVVVLIGENLGNEIKYYKDFRNCIAN